METEDKSYAESGRISFHNSFHNFLDSFDHHPSRIVFGSSSRMSPWLFRFCNTLVSYELLPLQMVTMAIPVKTRIKQLYNNSASCYIEGDFIKLFQGMVGKIATHF